MLTFKLFKPFSTVGGHTPICIIGAGSGGINLLGHLSRQRGFIPQNVRLFDPSLVHHYQPGWTMVAGGLANPENFKADTPRMITKNVGYEKARVVKIDPHKNTIFTADGKEFTYEHLVLSTGIRCDFDRIPGNLLVLFPFLQDLYCFC